MNPRGDFFQTMDAASFRQRAASENSRPAAPRRPAWDTEWRSTAKVADAGGSAPVYQTK